MMTILNTNVNINVNKSLSVFKRRAKQLSNCLLTASLSTLLLCSVTANANPATDLDQLLKQLEQGNIAQSAQNKAREAEFKAKVGQQQYMLNDVSLQRNKAIKLSSELELRFEENEVQLANKSDALDKRLGELKELFGVLQQVSGDTRSKFQTSVVSAEIANRGEFLDTFA